MIAVTVLYPQQKDPEKFNDYYLNNHIPLLQKHAAAIGLKRFEYRPSYPNPDGSPAPYHAVAELYYESGKALAAAMQTAEMKEVNRDLRNFCDPMPTIITGKVASDLEF